MKIVYDTPVVLGYAALSFIALVVDLSTNYWLSFNFLLCPAYFEPLKINFWTGILFHVFGHSGMGHYVGNFSLILLLGPALERRYGPHLLALMIFVTALVTGITNVMFFDTMVFGASGVAFMMAILVSMIGAKEGEIRVAAILVVILWIGVEVLASLTPDDIAHFAHIGGGIVGGGFGLLFREKFSYFTRK